MNDKIEIKAPNNSGMINGKNSGEVNVNNEMRAVSFGKTLTFSAEGTKSLIYINGGAAVAMLAFCGNYLGEIDGWSIAAVICFAVGALAGVCVLYAAYITQGNFTNFNVKRGNAFNACAFTIAIFAMILFFSGIITSACAIKSLQRQKNAKAEVKTLEIKTPEKN